MQRVRNSPSIVGAEQTVDEELHKEKLNVDCLWRNSSARQALWGRCVRAYDGDGQPHRADREQQPGTEKATDRADGAGTSQKAGRHRRRSTVQGSVTGRPDRAEVCQTSPSDPYPHPM